MLLDIGLMIQVRLDLPRLEVFADVLGLLDEILDFDETSRGENVATFKPAREHWPGKPGEHKHPKKKWQIPQPISHT